jgi:hypothetical protein
VSAAASVAVHFAGLQHGVRLVLDGEQTGWTSPHSGEAAGELLDRMALIQPGEDGSLGAAVDQLRRSRGDGIIVAVLGEVDEAVIARLAQLGQEGVSGVVVLMKTEEWLTQGHRMADPAGHRRRVAMMLRDSGWLVAEAGSGDTMTDAWSRALGLDAVRDTHRTPA